MKVCNGNYKYQSNNLISIQVAPCDNNPCLNGGLCSWDMYHGDISCECVNGFKGPRCQCMQCNYTYQCNNLISIQDAPCDDNPCMNGGICSWDMYHGDISCQCVNGFEGLICQGMQWQL